MSVTLGQEHVSRRTKEQEHISSLIWGIPCCPITSRIRQGCPKIKADLEARAWLDSDIGAGEWHESGTSAGAWLMVFTWTRALTQS